LAGGPDTSSNKFWPLVDVRDVVDAMLLAYEKAESSGRYICALDQMDINDLVVLKSMYPNYNYVDKQVLSNRCHATHVDVEAVNWWS
jgi:hypothetical protein